MEIYHRDNLITICKTMKFIEKAYVVMYIILEYTSNVQLMKTTCCLQARAVTDMLVRR